jgi:hypothetical protein
VRSVAGASANGPNHLLIGDFLVGKLLLDAARSTGHRKLRGSAMVEKSCDKADPLLAFEMNCRMVDRSDH